MSRLSEFLRRLLGGRSSESPSEVSLSGSQVTNPTSTLGLKRGGPSPTRRLHLGLDFGTCWSKMVLRDLESSQPRCFAIRPPATFKGHGDFRIPSSVVFDGKRLYFGWVGLGRTTAREAVVYDSPKMQAAFGERYALKSGLMPPGFASEDLAILAVAYLMEIGRWACSDYARRLPGSPKPKISMTMGVPMSMLDSEHLADKFLSIARVAFELYRSFPGSIQDGLPADEGLGFVHRAKELVASKGRVQDPRDWIRSEAEAGLLWAFRSPEVSEGCTPVWMSAQARQMRASLGLLRPVRQGPGRRVGCSSTAPSPDRQASMK